MFLLTERLDEYLHIANIRPKETRHHRPV